MRCDNGTLPKEKYGNSIINLIKRFTMKINDLSNLGTAYLHRLQVNFLNPEAPRKIPARIQIETSSKCNLRCLTCTNSRENDSGKFLTVNELQSILNRLTFAVEHVTLSGIGEPLLNPEFFS